MPMGPKKLKTPSAANGAALQHAVFHRAAVAHPEGRGTRTGAPK